LDDAAAAKEPRFQDQIKDLSTAVRNKEPILFEAAEAAALFSGFVDMSVANASAKEIIEDLETKLASKKLWRP
jgi:hypothetical protein